MNPLHPLLCAVAGFLLAALPARAADVDTMGEQSRALADLPLEALMRIEVTTASKHPQPLSDVASAVYVITGDDIRRAGANSLPEALRLAPGVDAARTGPDRWAVSIRGFNGRFANKLLVLVDGRSLYTPLFSGVVWQMQDTLLEDVERIEIIRGPGATLWGANAVNGVINIITRSARDTQGSLVVAGAGNRERAFGAVRHGGAVGEDTYYRMWAKGIHRPAIGSMSGAPVGEDSEGGSAGFRMDRDLGAGDRFTLLGQAHYSDSGDTVQSPALTPPFSTAIAIRERTSGANLLARLDRRLGEGSELSLQAWVDSTRINLPLAVEERRDTLDLELQHRLRAADDHDVVWGLGWRISRDRLDEKENLSFDPDSDTQSILSAFVQDEIALAADWHLTLGSKLEHSDFGGWQVQPGARLAWAAGPQTSVWTALSRAVRTPSRAERDARLTAAVLPPLSPSNPGPLPAKVVLVGTDTMDPEVLTTLEAGFRTRPTPRLSLDLAAFYSRYADLRQFSTDPSQVSLQLAPVPHTVVPRAVGNGLSARSHGFELAADWRPLDAWRLQASYSHLDIDVAGGADPEDFAGSAPRHIVSLRSSTDLRKDLQFDLWLRWVSARPMLNNPGRRVEDYATLDARIAWLPQRGLEISLTGQNLLQSSHAEFAPDLITSAPVEIPRGVYAKLSWEF